MSKIYFEPKKELPGKEYPSMADAIYECPVCEGHGHWRTEDYAKYGVGIHCSQCNGWGWVTKEDKDCIHEMEEYKSSMCQHWYRCKKCGVETYEDSSG